MSSRKELIEKGKTVLGIEFGSTRIKAVLIDENHHPIASGDHEWENRLENGIWTYSLDDIWQGLRDSYQKLAFNVEESYGVTLKMENFLFHSAHGEMESQGKPPRHLQKLFSTIFLRDGALLICIRQS